MKAILTVLAVVLVPIASFAGEKTWQAKVDEQVALLGHRNMIIIADSAYPIQVGGGVKVIGTGASHEAVVAHTAKAIEACPAVRPLIALDKEFAYVPEEHAPGAAKLRKRILGMLKGKSAEPIREALHEDLLKEVNETAGEYTVVVFKTTGVIPYSSVFFTLDCGYWSAEAEEAMRKKMKSDK